MRRPRRDEQLQRTARRLGLQAGVLIVTCLVAVALLQWVLVERSAQSAARQRLADVTRRIDKPVEAPRDVFVTISDGRTTSSSIDLPAGFPLRGDIAAVRRTGATSERSLSMGGHEYLVRTQRAHGRVVQAAFDERPVEEESQRLLGGLAWAGLVGVLLAVVMAYWLARRAVAPMSETIALQRRFVADASHELRTPLTLLSTRVQLLARRLRSGQTTGPDVAHDIEGVLADTHHLTAILDELLVAVDSREQGTRELQDLGALARDVVSSAQAEAQTRDLGLAVHVHGTATGSVSAPAVRRALVALVDNALDHAEHRVDVRVRRAGRRLVVTVEDDGPGMPPESIPYLFERFAGARNLQQGHAGRRHYGLGLALVSEIAHAHGGTVTATNRTDGPGAAISIELPAA